MNHRFLATGFCFFALVAGVRAQDPLPKSPFVERVGDTGFIQLQARSFAQLDEKQKQVAYWLMQASIAIDPIIYDQLSRFGLRQKRLLEGVVAHHDGVPPATFAKVREYALLFWANRGNHNETTAQKFVPSFTFDELQDAALKAQAAGAFASPSGEVPALPTADAVKKELADLKASIFDAALRAVDHREDAAAGQGHPAGQLEQLLSGRHAGGSEGLPGALSAQFARREGRARDSRRGLSCRHAGRQSAAGALRDIPQEGE